MRLRQKDLLDIESLSAEEIGLVLDTATSFKEIGTRTIKRVPTLRGRTVVNLFYEPSTRTRVSFEIAAKRLSADAINVSVSGSSVSKGETLLDTVRNLQAMAPDVLVMRHPASGAPYFVARRLEAAVVNAGDGMHEHPTQALLDAFTVRERKGTLSGLKIAIVGDLLHSRVFRSNVRLLTRMGSEVSVAGPPTLVPPEVEKLGARVALSIDDALAGADVIMMLRVQKERMQGAYFPSVREYFRLFALTRARMERAHPEAIILHPGPINRGLEIESAVADGPYSLILEQVTNGVAVRMAILYLLTGGGGEAS
ncbi:MAG TPA: aspartate carbamoyltransferase catalytic subunit [Vicinamibacteria bacterium]|nr:aspartate carbamoyltransferase catalytic subunit [Vicinamibacteria bacterium]